MGFSIDLTELKAIQKRIEDSQSLKHAEPLITNEFSKFNDLLSSRVSFLYAAPKTLLQISDNVYCLPSRLTDNVAEYQVTYPHKLLTISDYPVMLDTVSTPTAKRPKRLTNGYVLWEDNLETERVKVVIRRGKSRTASRTNPELKGFRYKKTSEIKARLQHSTWERYPSYKVEGIRAPIGTLYAPSLAQLGKITFDKDLKIRQALDNFPISLMEAVGINLLVMLTKD